MMTDAYQRAYQELLDAINLDLSSQNKLTIKETAPNIMTPFALNDVACAIFALLAEIAAKLANQRGVAPQTMTIDRRHAGHMLNSVAYHYQNSWQLDIHVVHTDINGFFDTLDGKKVIYNGAYPHLRKIILDFLNVPNNRTEIAKASKKHTSDDLENNLGALGACVNIVRTEEEWAAHPQGKLLHQVPVIELVKIADSPPKSFPGAIRPLSGCKVIDISKVLAGPTAGKILAEHGAEVLHIRHPYQDIIYPFDIETSYGKINSYLDYHRENQLQHLKKLCQETDIFLQGLRYGALEDIGFGPHELCKHNPHLIYTQINAFGYQGPWAKRHGFEQLAQACTGAASIQGGDIDNPQLVPAYMNDYLTGYLAAVGTMAALMKQSIEGGAWLVNVSLARTCMFVMSKGRQDLNDVRPTEFSDIKAWLVDQPSSLGVLTRLAPPIDYSHTPMYTRRPASAPGSDLCEFENVREDKIHLPYYPSKCFDKLCLIGDMSLR